MQVGGRLLFLLLFSFGALLGGLVVGGLFVGGLFAGGLLVGGLFVGGLSLVSMPCFIFVAPCFAPFLAG